MSATIIRFPRSKSGPPHLLVATTQSRVDELRAELNAVLTQGTAPSSFMQGRRPAIDNLFATVAQIHARVMDLKKHVNDTHVRHPQH